LNLLPVLTDIIVFIMPLFNIILQIYINFFQYELKCYKKVNKKLKIIKICGKFIF